MTEYEKIKNICKSSEHALSLNLEGYYVTDDGKLYSGWWDEICPQNIEDRFQYCECLQWMKENIKGATYLYVLTTFWGCDHTEHYVFEYANGNYKFTEHTFAIT